MALGAQINGSIHHRNSQKPPATKNSDNGAGQTSGQNYNVVGGSYHQIRTVTVALAALLTNGAANGNERYCSSPLLTHQLISLSLANFSTEQPGPLQLLPSRWLSGARFWAPAANCLDHSGVTGQRLPIFGHLRYLLKDCSMRRGFCNCFFSRGSTKLTCRSLWSGKTTTPCLAMSTQFTADTQVTSGHDSLSTLAQHRLAYAEHANGKRCSCWLTALPCQRKLS